MDAGRIDRVVPTWSSAGLEQLAAIEDESLKLANMRVRTGLRMPDCCALLAAVEGADGIATFDLALANAGRGLSVRVIQ